MTFVIETTVTGRQVDDAIGSEHAAQPTHKRQPEPLIRAGHDRDLRHARLRSHLVRIAVIATLFSREDFPAGR